MTDDPDEPGSLLLLAIACLLSSGVSFAGFYYLFRWVL